MTAAHSLPSKVLETAAHAHAGITDAAVCLLREKQKLSQLQTDLEFAGYERDRLQAKEDSAAALRLIDGAADAPKSTSRTKKLADLNQRIPILTAAIHKQREIIATADAARLDAQRPLVAAILNVIVAVQGDGAANAKTSLVQLARPFAELIAADQIRAAFIGANFAVPQGCKPPFSGMAIIRRFVKALPEQLRPPELEEDRLMQTASGISKPIIETIKGA